jgi:hypothetical protein
VVEAGLGIVVYPPAAGGEPWRAAFTENGRRRFRQDATEAGLAAKLEQVRERLSAGAAGMERPGADLIAWYLNPDRLPVRERWSRKHAHTQRRLCERFAVPVIGAIACQDIKAEHTQAIVNAAPTAGEGNRVRGWSPPWSAPAWTAATWSTRGWRRCTGSPEIGRCPYRR